MTEACCSLSRRMMRKISSASCSVSEAVGSSMTRIRACPARARAISTIRRSAMREPPPACRVDRREAKLVEQLSRALAHRRVVDACQARSGRQLGNR